MIGRRILVPLRFAAGKSFQFDWSEDWAVINGERTKLQVAYLKLGRGHAFFLRSYRFIDSLASKPLHRFRALCPCVTGITTGQRMSHFFFP
jgi:hypothetical protein